MHHQRSGYILLLTIGVVSLAVTLVTYVFSKSVIQIPFTQAMNQREKARRLAMSGLEIAISQLTIDPENKDKKSDNAKAATEKKDAQTPAPGAPEKKDTASQEGIEKKLLKKILPLLNHWQIFQLKEDVDGIDGQIKICIMSEDGKLNINQLYDFEKHAFKGGTQINIFVTEGFKQLGKQDLSKDFEKFLKERQYKLDDVSELLAIKGFEGFRNSLFFEPSQSKDKDKGNDKQPTYLSDLFTVWGNKETIDPWLLSTALMQMFGLKRADADKSLDERKKLTEQWIKNFKPESSWAADWNKILAPIYGKQFTALPKGIELLLSPKFDPKIFSVLSYGKVGEITQRVLAIMERTTAKNADEIENAVKIKKLYWL